MPESDDEEFNTGLLLIHKIHNRRPREEQASGRYPGSHKESLGNMGKPPELLYTDDEGSFHSKQAVSYYRDNKVQHLITRTHAPYAERAIRTINAMLYKRLEAKPGAVSYTHLTLPTKA